MKLSKIIPVNQFQTFAWVLKQTPIAEGATKTLFDVLKSHLTLSQVGINRHYESSSAIFAFWGTFLAREKYRHQRMERNYNRKVAIHYARIKRRYDRVTETQVKQELTQVKELSEMRDALDVIEHRIEVLKIVVEAMRMRSESVVNLGAQLRKELGITDSTYTNEARQAMRDRIRKG